MADPAQAGRAPDGHQRDASDADPLVVVSSLRRTFGARPPVAALDGVDLRVEEGSFTAILGPSGSGKTTLLRVLAGTERADSGTVVLAGTTVDGAGSHVPPERRRVGLVPQEGALFPHLDVAGNVGFGLHRLPRPQRRARVVEMLELVGLAGLEHRRAHELSGGQAQRVALARALAPEPQVVLLDEPFSALDASLRVSVRTEVAELLRSTGTTAVLVTHDQDEAISLADTVAVMRSGRIVAHDTPDELYRRPTDLWTAGFLGDAVLLDGVLLEMAPGDVRDVGGDAEGPPRVVTRSVVVRCALGDIAADLVVDDDARGVSVDGARGAPVGVGGALSVFLRPEQVWRVPTAGSPGGRGTSAAVVSADFAGPHVEVVLDVDGALVSARWPSSFGDVRVGERIDLTVLGRATAFASAV